MLFLSREERAEVLEGRRVWTCLGKGGGRKNGFTAWLFRKKSKRRLNQEVIFSAIMYG